MYNLSGKVLCICIYVWYITIHNSVTYVVLTSFVLQQEYHGVCGITYMDEDSHYYEFQEDCYTDAKTYENIQVPEIDNFNRATILHDFEMVLVNVS